MFAPAKRAEVELSSRKETDKLVPSTVTDFMKAEKMPITKIGKFEYFKVPPGWLAKYLARNGPERLFGKQADWDRLRRAKK